MDANEFDLVPEGDVAHLDVEQLNSVLSEIRKFESSELGKFFNETFESLRDESRDLALSSVPKDFQADKEREQHIGGYRAFQRARNFFEELRAELNNQLENNE